MNAKDVELCEQRLAEYARLKELERRYYGAYDTLSKISGNFSEIHEVVVISLSMNGITDPLNVYSPGITNYDIRQALLPLVKAKLDQVRTEIEKL